MAGAEGGEQPGSDAEEELPREVEYTFRNPDGTTGIIMTDSRILNRYR